MSLSGYSLVALDLLSHLTVTIVFLVSTMHNYKAFRQEPAREGLRPQLRVDSDHDVVRQFIDVIQDIAGSTEG